MSATAPTAPQRSALGVAFSGPLLLKIAAVGAALVLLVFISLANPAVGVFWVFGLAFGFILQRSRLCFASAFRDLFLLKDGRNMRAIVVGLAVASLGFVLLMAKSVPDPTAGALPNQAHIIPVGPYLFFGGLLFGFGMVVAGGCVSGTLLAMRKGYVASVVSLVGILIGLELVAHSWNWWWTAQISHDPVLWLPSWLGYSGGLVVTLVLLAAAFLLTYWQERGHGPQVPLRVKPQVEPVTIRGHVAKIHQQWFVNGWPITTGAVALALLNIFTFTVDRPLGVTGELSVWAGRASGLVGWAAGPLQGAAQLAGCNLATGSGGPWLTETFAIDAGL
ncbi:MAG: YeeE/YedE family protein, partial [Chloroflexi bacterium]|nr:YeeE/YedE family protein [Chloroflexota bacterium]